MNLTPSDIALLGKVLALVGTMIASGAVAAVIFRNLFSCGFILVCFLVTLVMIPVTLAAAASNNVVFIFASAMLFGAAVGADLGGFTLAVAARYDVDVPRAMEAVGITLGIIGVITVGVAGIALFTGFNFQGLSGVLMFGLFILLGISAFGMFSYWNRMTELLIGLGASLFWTIYLLVDFNRIVAVAHEGTWSEAMKIALNIYLDLVNLFVRLLPIIMQALSHKK